ncbi:DUF1858 domain-containing protein [Candidatus Micrarchaeota archaeon]|nr:DUF1858 domain-containing protein [Candidatus Micrarchaeota archaeon]
MIKKTDNIMKTLQENPEAIKVFVDFGFGCIGCAAAHYETIEQGAEAHGINVEALVDALNKTVKPAKKKK